MKKTLTFLAVSTTLALAKTSTTIMPYSAYVKYSDSIKDKAYVVGFYSSIYSFPNKFELGLENIDVQYNNGIKDLDQNDITAVYTRYFGKNYFVKGGVHYINSDDKPTDEGIVGVFGVNYYKYLKYNLGLDVYYSKYKNYQPKELKVLQLRPYAGINFGKYSSKWGSFYLEAEVNYIKPNSPATYGFSKSYTSVGLKLTNYNGKWTTSIGGWAGKKLFAVDNGGFTVYNLGEVYKAGVDASVDYAFRPTTHLKVKYSCSKFTEGKTKAHSSAIAATLSHIW